MDYPQEQFTAAEQRLLEPHFTNLDSPVFCVVDLPEVDKGALFARYSRYGGTLRRLYLDEFAGEGEAGGAREGRHRPERDQLYERVFLEFGDDSVAQLGGAHLACEWSSNVLTKILQRGRLAAYLEQSTRYIAYDRRMPSGRYRYYWDERLGAPYAEAMERIFDLYSAGLERMRAWAAEQHPRGDEPRDGVGAVDQGEGARRDARAAARGLAQPRRRVRLGPGLRAAAAAAAGLAAAGGARVRRAGAARAAQGDPGVREARRHARPRRRVDRVPARGARAGLAGGGALRPRRRSRRRGAAVGAAHARRRVRGGPDRRVAVRGERRAGGGAARRGGARSASAERARADRRRWPARARNRRHRPGPRLGGAALPLRDRLRLRRLPRPAAPPHADLRVAAPRLRAGRRRARGGRGRRLRRRVPRGPRGEPRRVRAAARARASSRRRPTRSRSRTASATCST